MLQLAVDALRRGAILVAKLNLDFQILGFLEIQKSTALRLLERAVAMDPPGTLVEMIRISPDPGAELGIAVAPVEFVQGMCILKGHVPGCPSRLLPERRHVGLHRRGDRRVTVWLVSVEGVRWGLARRNFCLMSMDARHLAGSRMSKGWRWWQEGEIRLRLGGPYLLRQGRSGQIQF
jgi:hypothetical protein